MSIKLVYCCYALVTLILISDFYFLIVGILPIPSNSATSFMAPNDTYTFALENSGWNTQIKISNYNFEQFCTNLIYTSRMYDDSSYKFIAYSDNYRIFDDNNNQIYSLSERNMKSLKNCFTLTSVNVTLTVQCYPLTRRYDFLNSSNEVVATIILNKDRYSLTTYTESDLRMYGSFISMLLFTPSNLDICNYYFIYTCSFNLIVFFTHCFLYIWVRWIQYYKNRNIYYVTLSSQDCIS